MARIRRFFCALAALALLAAGAFAQSAPASPPALTREDLEAWLDAFVPRALQQGDIAGLAVAVVKEGQVLLEKGYGLADVRGKVPVNAGTVMRVASLSKAFTATAVMQLVEQGKIGLDQDINEYLDFRVPAAFGKLAFGEVLQAAEVNAIDFVGIYAAGILEKLLRGGGCNDKRQAGKDIESGTHLLLRPFYYFDGDCSRAL